MRLFGLRSFFQFDHCQLEFSPSKGSIDSKESITIDLISTWKTEVCFFYTIV